MNSNIFINEVNASELRICERLTFLICLLDANITDESIAITYADADVNAALNELNATTSWIVNVRLRITEN